MSKLLKENLQLLNNKIHIIGVTGGSGAGKTYLCKNLVNKFNDIEILKIKLDSYYFDLKHLPMKEREKNNFDHPSSFDFNLLYNDLKKLKKNIPIKIPIYDYKTHTRKSRYDLVDKKYCLILVEGILSLYNEQIRNMLYCSVYINISNEIRKNRRIARDLVSRDRTIESITKQYSETVEPMYRKYIEPTKKFADISIREISNNDKGYIELINKINSII